MGLVVGIDASNIRDGGGVTHLSQLLSAAEPESHDIRRVIVWGSRVTLGKLPNRIWLEKEHVPTLDRPLPWRVTWQQFVLPRKLRSRGCDLLFSPGGTLPWAASFPSYVMSQNMLPFEPAEATRYGILAPMRAKLHLLRQSQSRSFKRSDGIIFLSRYAFENISCQIGQIRGRASIIPHGIENRFFREPRAALPPSAYSLANPFRVLYVSTVDLYKHQWVVAEAVADLRRKGLPLVLDFVGRTTGAARKRFFSVLYRLDPKREFLYSWGPVEFDRLPEKYSKADAFVFASSCENLPNILLEAMASGLPIASSNRGPMPEVLGSAGLYFDPESADQIAEVLQKLFEDNELRSKLSERAYARAREYSWERCARDTLRFLTQPSQRRRL